MAHVDPDMQALEAMEKTYTLTCKIVPHEVSYDDEQSQGKLGNITRKVVGFVPIMNSQMTRFFDAYLGVPGKLVECMVRFDHPFDQYARCAVLHPKSVDPTQSNLEDHHLFLMSYGLSEIILAKKDLHGKEIQVTVPPASEDHPDGAPTDAEFRGDELYSGTRKQITTGLENRIVPPGSQLIADPNAPDRHGRKFPPLKG
jgi:hypothetical protein